MLLGTSTHAPVGRQHAPVMLGHGSGVQEVLAYQVPQQQASVVTVHPAGSVGQAEVAPAAVVVVLTLVHAVVTQQAPTGRQFTAAQD